VETAEKATVLLPVSILPSNKYPAFLEKERGSGGGGKLLFP
jgi:hypothetical protein